jgi:hypothetical protein
MEGDHNGKMCFISNSPDSVHNAYIVFLFSQFGQLHLQPGPRVTASLHPRMAPPQNKKPPGGGGCFSPGLCHTECRIAASGAVSTWALVRDSLSPYSVVTVLCRVSEGSRAGTLVVL